MDKIEVKPIKKYEIITLTHNGVFFKRGYRRTVKALRKAKDAWDKEYGGYLTAQVFAYYVNGEVAKLQCVL
jgi:hypothetical protein